MTLRVDYELKVITTETDAGFNVSPGNNSITYGTALTESTNGVPLTESTTPPVTKRFSGELPMVAGAATIDLTALPDGTDMTGLKVQTLILRSKDTNAALVTVSKGAANGYGLGASGADWTIPLSPGQPAMLLGKDANPDVAAGAKDIDVAGTGTEVLEYDVTAG